MIQSAYQRFIKSPLLDSTFKVGIILKGIDGAAELIGGTVLMIVSGEALNRFAVLLIAGDPDSVIAGHITRGVEQFAATDKLFGALYLLSHGIVKIILVWALLKERLWAYPWMIAFLIAFTVYQIYHMVLVNFSIGMLLLTIFDVLIIWLTWIEYKKHQRHYIMQEPAKE